MAEKGLNLTRIGVTDSENEFAYATAKRSKAKMKQI